MLVFTPWREGSVCPSHAAPQGHGAEDRAPLCSGEQEAEDVREPGEGGEPGQGQTLNVRARGRASGLRKKQQVPRRRGSAAPSGRLLSALACRSGSSPRPQALPLRGCLPCQAPRTNRRKDRPGKPQRARGPSGSLPVTHAPREEGLSPEVSRRTRVAGDLRGPRRIVWGLAGRQWEAHPLGCGRHHHRGRVKSPLASGRGTRLHTTPGPSWAPPGTLPAELEAREGMDVDASEAEKVNRSPSGWRGALLTPPSHLWAIRGQRRTSCSPRAAGVVLAAGSRR